MGSICVQNGRREYAWGLRHKDVRLCPRFALSLYLFARWHVDDEGNGKTECPLDFSARRTWSVSSQSLAMHDTP